MKTIKPYIITLLFFFLTSTVFLSCSKDDIITNDFKPSQAASETNIIEESKVEEVVVKPYSLEKNVNKFSIEYLNISNKVATIYKKSKIEMFNPSLKLKLNSAKNLDDVFGILRNSKTENNAELISLLVKKINLAADFIKEINRFKK